MSSNAGEPGPAPRVTRRKRLLQNAALALGTFLFCVGAFELVLRLNGYGQLEIYEPDSVLYWKLKPNQNCYTKIDHKPVHINSHGTRGPEFQTQKPAGTLRILCLGDSRTFGWGLSEAETYSGVLERLLRQAAGPGQRVEVINCGVNAWSYSQMELYFDNTARTYQPDMVIIAEANLWTQFSTRNSPEFVKKFMRRVRLKNLLRRSAIYHYVVEVKLKDFYERARTRFIPVDPARDPVLKAQQQTDPEALFRDALEHLCRIARTNGTRAVLLSLPVHNEDPTQPEPAIQRIKREISDKLEVPLVDLTADVRKAGKELYLEGDPVHFNSAGNALIAQRLLGVIQPMLLEKR